MPAHEISVRYTLTKADLMASARRSIRRNPVLIGLVCIGFVYVCVSSFNFASSDRTHPMSTAGCAIVALVSALAVVGIGVCGGAIAMLLMFYTRKHNRALEERTVAITEGGLAVKSESFEGAHKWTHIRRIVSTRKRLIIYWDSAAGFIIPKRCFNSPAEAEEFEQEIRRRWQSALTPTSSAR